MKNIKSKIKKAFRTAGLHISQSATDPALLKSLVAKLKPVDTGIELIRVGGDNDGGYLLPDDMEGIR